MATNNKNTDWRANVKAMMTDPNYAEKMASVVDGTRKVNTNLMNKSEELESSLSLDKPTSQPLDLSRVQEMQTEQAARATMPDDDSGVADLAVKAYADARKQIGDEVSKQMADDKSMAFVHPMAAGILRSAESMKAGDVQKTFDRMLENNAVRQAIETKANKELTAALGKNPALTEEQQKDIYNKSVQRQIDAISGRVNQYLLDVNAPKSESEYVLKSAVGNSLIGKSMLQAARNISGLESAEYDYAQQALADYDANKASWYGKGGAAIGSLLLDAPMMQGIGSASSAVLGRGTSMALGKAASNTLWGKMLIGQATAAGTLGGYNFTSTLASQMMGGRFDAGELFGSTLHGVGLGAATGGMTPLLRGATAGMGAVGKTATMGGGILGEAAAFSAPEWVETFNENPYDFKAYAEALGTNVMVIAGLKASNLPKTVQEYKEWWNQGKTSGFTDADYKALSDYALAKGYANDGAFTYQDGVYQRSMADRATGGRNILTMTKLEGGKERNLAMEMYQDPNVPLSMKTKIAAKMGLPAPNPVLPNAVEARDNVVNTYYEYREQMSDGTYVTRRILVDSKEMPSKRKARAAASEFGRTKARQNSIIQSEAEANTDATNAIVMARLTEQAWRSGTNVSDEVARMYDIAQRAQRGEASAEDITYYQSVMEGTTEVTDRIKADIKDKTGVDIDEVLKQEGTFNTAQDKALTMYSEALASLKDSSKPTTERGTTASQASIADYIELKGMGIEQTKQLLNDPTAKVAAEKEIRNKYALWLKYFDGQMSEEQLATRLGYNLDNTKGLMDFVNEEAFFRGKAANRIAYNAANAAKRLLEQGSGGVRFTEDGKVKLQGVPYSIAVDESIVDRYRAAQQGSGENYQRIANDALKDIIRQSEQPIEEMLQQMTTDEQAVSSEPQTEQEAVTQQMVDNRLAEIDTDLQGIEADGIQRVNINDKPAMIVKGRIAYISNGEIDRANSSAEVAYIPLDENGRPIKNEQGKPVVEVGVKPSNVRISEVEPWRTVEDYKRAEEQRIRDNNRITDEAIAQVDEQTEVENQVPTEPKTADDLLVMCDGDKALALDVATDELAKAMQAKGKGATPAETIEINKRIRMYQQMVDRLSATEQPDAATLPEAEQTSEATKAEPQVTEDMEFVYQKDLGENHEGMEPMQMADGRYKWVGLQRGELTATMGERDVELLDGLAKKLGVAVIPINVADSAVNGYYRDGNIYVNTNRGADWTMRWVAGHEMLHDVAKKSPEAYDAYKQAVLDMWGSEYIDDQVKQIIDDYAASGKTIDREQALTELVNDFGGELFNSRDGLNILDNILKGESRKGNTGFVETIKQWWERLKEWFSGTPYYKNVEKLLKDAYSEAIANAEEFRRNQEMDKGVSSVTDAARVEGAAIDFSIKTEPQVAQRLREYAESEDGKKHGWDKEKIESIIDETEDLIDAIHNSLQGNQRYDAWADKNPTMRVDWRDGELKQTVTWSRGNIEYKYDMSADLLCINNEALEDVLASPAMVQIVRGMDTLSKNGFTSDDYLRIYQVLRDKGFVVPCAGCFDAAARFKMLPSVAKNFADLVNKTIDERNADPEVFDAKVKAMAKGETTIEGLPTSANTKQDAIMIGVAGDKLTEHITSEQLLSAQGQTDMLATLGGIFRAWQRTGAGRPKDKLLPEPYVGDINSTSTTILGKYGEKTPSYRDIYVNQGTGLRRNSHSEFRPLLAIDEIQFMRDAFAKGLTVFKYMKELDDVRLFGNMGVKFNMSFFPAFAKDGVAAGLDANGNYIASEESVGSREFAYMGEDGRTHFDGMKGWQEAQKYTNENVSLSSVVFSVPHLIKSLTDVPTPSDKSGMWGSLIPFHSTGATSAHLALQGLGRARANGIGHPFSEAMHDYNKGVTNFEDVQNDRFGEGWVIVEGKKAGTAIKDGHKLEFVNGTHMYNERLGVHLFKDGYIFDKDIKKKDNYGNGKVNTKNVKKYMTKFYVDYNDKVRELGGDYAYKDAADYYLRELPKIGLMPRFSFEVPESIYLEMCKAANVDPKHPKLGWKGEGNAWNPIDAESYYSLFCDYGMTDPKTGKWSPHKPIGNVDENGNRVFRLPDNAVQIVKDAVDKYSARRDKEESRINDVYEEFLKRSVKDGRLSEAEAQNLLSEISADADYSISRKIDEKYPNWLEGTTTSSGKHSTQVAGTIGTYRKVGKWIKENLGNDIRILDASSGMGLGTEALRKDGVQIDDVEPYQSEERKKTNPATFSSYKDINGKYDFIISNAVLNVIPDDWRSNVLHDMVARLNNGGRLFINTRKAGEEKTIKDKIELDSPQEILVKRNGKIASYQRFFTPNELKEWVENELGEGYSVEVANEKNSGTKGLAAVVVRKLGEQPTDPNGGGIPTEEFSIKADKQKQLDIINRTNPAPDDYHTWVRTTDDIKTLQEAVDEVRAEDPEYNLSSYPDVTDDMINKALQSGKVTVYSSYPIKEGVFVSPSKMQAKDYAGGGRVYSKQVSISDVAWINTDEGMFAPTEYSVKGKRADESVLDYAKRMSEDADYSIKIGGRLYHNDGYTQREDGTNVSIRALDAEENGTYPKGIFAKVYGVSRKDFDTLADLGVIENTEWHHTGTNFNKTDYFSWADSDEAKDGDVDYSDLSNLDAQSMGARYKANKKEINSLINKYNESEWGALPKMKRSIPTLEAFTERYVTNATGITSSDQWLTSAERKQKAENHNEVSASATMRDSYERYLTHKYIDELYYETAEKHKNDWIEAHSEEIQNEYNSLKKEVDEYNLTVKPIAEVYSNHAKGKYLMQALELLGYSPEDAAEIIARRHKSDNWDSYTRKAEMARDAVNKEYDEKIETAQKNLDKWLSKAVKDGKAEFVERVATKPEYFITTKEEMNGRYGWFEATSRYNLPTYYSGYKFESKRMFDSYKRRTGQITDIRREASSRAVDAYNTELDKRYAVEFSIKGGNTPERRADEVARLKQKIEQLSQEKDAIAEDGAKVKDIASEMTSFIKQNISTEVQSDMTRNQFKGILNQLENAVTKKDLEKPMQMVEYIGTNVTRRSLTRQMRNFLKSEFKSMTPQGAVKAKTVDGATSRVLELAKTMYATMNKLPLGGEVAALQKQMRDLKADATEWATDQSADTKNLLADVLKTTERPAATRYNELAELRNKMAADGSASGEMLGYIDHMLDIMGDIDYFRGEQQKAKEASALNSKEDLEALKSELLDKSDKGILSEEEKAVLDNMPLYEMMVNLRQQQLDIDGGGAASIDAQIRNKQNAIKAYRAKMNELPKTDTTGRERYKKLIEQVEGEIDDLFASRIVDQKAVNNGMRELIDDLVTLKEQGHSRLVEWSKGKQERSNGIRKLANDSFSSTARGYWDEVNKKGHRLRDINNFLNNAKLIMISPALSFEYMLGTLDKKYYTNDSPIYNRFIKSQDGLLKANDNFFEGLEAYNKEVNAAANRLIGRGAITNMAEWFKLGDRFVTEEIPFAFEVDQMFDDGTVKKVTKGITATMTRGQAAKIYAWSRMADGMAKLKAHGVTDETLAAVKDFIGEGYMRFVDWVEDDFFPRLRREKYNPKYKEIYGISMAENEHYFPFAIYKKDVRTNTDLEQIGDDKLGGGLVGNLIERKRNNARLDFTRKSPDIFDMITRYGETMEEWTAYAQVREDLKAMVNDKQFKVKCDMFGTDYYKHFLEAARVASRTSDDKALAGKWNTFMSKLQKVLASSAISMRVSTALKQLLSAPAFAVYSLDPKFLHQLEKTVVPIDVESAIKGLWKIGSGDLTEAKKLLLSENWVGHYNWCINNLPSFRERVSLGGAGNPILEEKGFGKLCNAVQSAGMIPNRLVDAFTCSVGAKAVYEYNFNKYKKMYGEKTAHNMAVTEAEIAFNSSQQSSNPVFLSPMQVSKQFFLRGLMNFKNSPIGYLRAGLKANIDIVRAIKSIYNPTFKVDGQEMRFNSNGKNANSMLMTAAARSAMYNFFLNFIWNLGTVGIAGLSYTAWRNLSGEGSEDGNLLYSDEEWKKATGDNWASTLFLCATQGLPYISGPFSTAEQGTEFAPLMLLNTLNEMGTDIYQNGLVSPVTAQWITNLALKNGAGIDPQVCAQVYEGMQGILADRPVTEEDIMNLLASPRSAISGMTKQKVGEFDRMRDYVDARIKSNREIGIDERMDFGKALAGKRELRKSNLDYYIDEYLEANIPGYREISGRKSKETKQEEQANKKLYEQSMSLVEKIVSTPKGEADEQKSSKIDSEDYDTKYKVRKLRDAVAAIHKLYAAGDFSTAEDIAEEMQRRIERGYDPNGKTLDERLKNVDIWKPAVEVTQKSADGYSTNFDRAIGGEFKKMYVGKMNGEGN